MEHRPSSVLHFLLLVAAAKIFSDLRRVPIDLTKRSANLDVCTLASRNCRRPLHSLPVVAVFGSTVDADLVISAIGSFQWPRKAVKAAKQQFT